MKERRGTDEVDVSVRGEVQQNNSSTRERTGLKDGSEMALMYGLVMVILPKGRKMQPKVKI